MVFCFYIIYCYLYIILLLFGFLCLGLGVFCNPFVRGLLGFDIIIGNFLFVFWEFPILI